MINELRDNLNKSYKVQELTETNLKVKSRKVAISAGLRVVGGFSDLHRVREKRRNMLGSNGGQYIPWGGFNCVNNLKYQKKSKTLTLAAPFTLVLDRIPAPYEEWFVL